MSVRPVGWSFAGVLAVLAVAGSGCAPKAPRTSPAGARLGEMHKVVTEQASFVLYLPAGWKASETAQAGYRILEVADAGGAAEARLITGVSPAGPNLTGLARLLFGAFGRSYPDLRLVRELRSPDGRRLAVDGTYTDPHRGPREFRSWLTLAGSDFVFSAAIAPAGGLGDAKANLLRILANVRVTKGTRFAAAGGPAGIAPLRPYRLRDGSASFQIPAGWRVLEMGRGQFLAGDGNGGHTFLVASVDVLSPALRVRVPGVPVAPYMRPHQAWEFLSGQQGRLRHMRFLEVNPRPGIARELARGYTAGPVGAEDFLYTCEARNGRLQGYTLGICFGSRLGANWSFRHFTVLAPAGGFERFAPTFAAMLGSYRINGAWARSYIQQGMARLHQMQQQTAERVARNAEEIHATMQAACDERSRSQDYLDYQRTNFIRGQQDWVSDMEGGTVYHTDSWGTQNTTTDERWEGQPFDYVNYVNYTGKNPKYNEQMTAIDSRELWEQHIRGQ